MRFLLFSFAALLLSTCAGCVLPAGFFDKMGEVASTIGRVAVGVGKVSEKLTAVSAKLAAKPEGVGFNDLLVGLAGLVGGGALTGGSVFAVRNGRKKNGGS